MIRVVCFSIPAQIQSQEKMSLVFEERQMLGITDYSM